MDDRLMVIAMSAERDLRRLDDRVDLRRGDHERRQVADDCGTGAEREDAALLKGLQRRPGILLQLDPLDEAEAADLADFRRRDRGESIVELLPTFRRRLREAQSKVL